MTRNYSIDVMRILSAIAVVVIHTVTAPVKNATGEVEGSLSNSLYLINMLLLWAVPVFFMITGYCLSLKKECTYSYCLHHVLKFIKILFTVGLFYSLLEEVFIAKKFSITILGTSILNVFTGNLWDHMWFIYAIIGVYLVMPVLHSFM